MLKRILVAVDGSESSLNALKVCVPLIRAEKAEAIAVSVVPPYDGELRLVGVKNVAATLRGPYEKALAESEKIARDAGIRVHTFLAEGEPHEEIVDVAEGCGLIVEESGDSIRLKSMTVLHVQARAHIPRPNGDVMPHGLHPHKAQTGVGLQRG